MTRPAFLSGLARGARSLLAGLLLSVLALGAASPAEGRPRGPLADSLVALAGESLDQVSVGALAISMGRGDTLLAWREDRRLVPASNTKLFSSGAFLKRFGPDTRWATLVLARGSASLHDEGSRARFKGDLVLRGSGIPDVAAIVRPGSRGLLDSIAVLLRAGGLERFEGTLWVDGSVFAPEPYPDGWAHEDFVYSYAAPVNGILANGNAAALTANGGPDQVTLTLDPPEAPIELRGRPSVGPPGSVARLVVRRDPGSRVIEVSGSVPPGGTARRPVAVPDPDSTAGLFLLGAMRRAGIETRASVRVLPARSEDAGKRRKDVEPFFSVPWDESAPSAAAGWKEVRKERATPVARLLSPTASEIVGAVEPLSMNTESEALLRLLDPSPRWKRHDRGLGELMRIVSEAGVDTMDLYLSDGSGLSRMNLVTTRAIVAWLTALDRDPGIGSVFRQSLSRPGGLGTLEHRLAGLEEGIDVRAKTGTLRNVTALSGYLTAPDGERIVFSIVSNGTRGSVAPARVVEDALVHLLSRYRRDAAPSARPLGIPR